MLRSVTLIVLLWLVTACSGTPPPTADPAPAPAIPSASSTPKPTPVAPSEQSPTAQPTPPPEPQPEPPRAAPSLRGIDVSHHQGAIDWPAVSRDGIDFAYLKATEGRTFTDPRFATNSRDADAAGLRVGAYHYFSLCSPGREQGQHFAATIGAQTAAGVRLAMPPAVDLELLGSCSGPPARDVLLGEVRDFIDVVERATGQRVIVYSFPDFEDRYAFAGDISGD